MKLNASEDERKKLQEQLDALNKEVAELKDKVKSLEKTMNDNYEQTREAIAKFEKYMLQHPNPTCAQSA